MSSEKVEGTIVLDGLVQGRLPDDGDIRPRLEEWVQLVGKLGLIFNLEVRDGRFSLLPDNRSVPTKALGDPPEHALEQAMQQLAEVFDADERPHLFSTLRTSHYRKGEEVQTVFTIVQGLLHLQSRTLPADTVAPPEPISTKEQIKLAVIGSVIALAVLGIALLFPGVRAMFGQIADVVKPLDTKEFTVELGPYSEFISCTLDEKRSDRTALILQFKRTEKFPETLSALDMQAMPSSGNPFRRCLALESLARGYIRVELFDPDGKYLATGDLRVRDLWEKPEMDAKLPLPEKVRTTRLVFVP
jgi:hypothetical protein